MPLDETEKDELFEARFNARYAYRAVLRQCRFWSRMDNANALIAAFAGTAAFAAITGQHARLAFVIGLVLAFTQLLSLIIRLPEKAVRAQISAQRYRRLVSTLAVGQDAAALRQALTEASQQDDVEVFEWIRQLAYNDALRELSADEQHAYRLSGLAVLGSWLV